MSASSKATKAVVKTISKKANKGGRKRKRRGPAPATDRQKNAAQALGMSIKEIKKLSPSELEAKLKARTPESKPEVKRTPKEQRQLSALIKQQKKDDADFGPSDPPRIKLTAGGSEVLPSKAQLDPKIKNYSKRRLRELIKTGQAKMVVGRDGKRKLVTTGKFAPPASEVARDMGRKADPEKKVSGVKRSDEQYEGSGDAFNPLLEAFDPKKYGGKVKRRMGGKVKGYGKAMRGY